MPLLAESASKGDMQGLVAFSEGLFSELHIAPGAL